MAKVAVQVVNQPIIPGVTDHRTTLLREARAFTKSGEEEVAILLYATWFEHWINGLLSKRGRHVGLNETERRLAIPRIHLEAKYKCIPTLLQMPRLSASHIKHILYLSQLRNEFAHYKFVARDVNTWSAEEKQLQSAIARAEKAVKYLSEYERRNIYKKSKSRIRRLVRH